MSLSDWELLLLLLGIESWVQVAEQLIDQEEALSSLLLQGQETWVWGRQSGASCRPSALLALLRRRQPLLCARHHDVAEGRCCLAGARGGVRPALLPLRCLLEAQD